ncbi:MAG: hypothetical protein LBV30_09475 [Propionibacteriaceae bacterium]|nr:hypothetical protein [Propionibacteriaceae bacterium]
MELLIDDQLPAQRHSSGVSTIAYHSLNEQSLMNPGGPPATADDPPGVVVDQPLRRR